jgi:hypothetical protein
MPLLGVFLLSGFAYLIFISQMLLNNHASRFPWLAPGGIGSGRWLSPYVGMLHYTADLPVFSPVLAIVMGLAGAALVLRRWKLGISPVSVFLVLGLMLTFPANLANFYYGFMTPVLFGSVFLAGAAFYVTDRLQPLRVVLGSVLVLLMMATYQLGLSILVTAAVTAAIASITLDPGKATIREAFKVAVARGIATGIGGAAYRFSLYASGDTPPRTIEYTSWITVPKRMWEVISYSFEHLLVTQPELFIGMKRLLLALLVAAALASLFKARRSLPAVLALIVLWPLAVIGTKATFFFVVPDGPMWEYRYNVSLGYLHAFSVALLLAATAFRPLARRLVQVVAVGIIVYFVQADLLRQGVLLRGQQHDLAIANRILARIETLSDLDPTKTYDLIRVGKYSFYRYGLLNSGGYAFERLGDSHMDIGEISDRWVDEDVFRLLGSSVKFASLGTDSKFTAKIKRIQDELLKDRRPWPAPESVFINGDEIIVFMRREE